MAQKLQASLLGFSELKRISATPESAAGEKEIAVWTFTAKNLGRIDEAHVEVTPLVLMIGRNNTGKSYAATAAWALRNLGATLNGKDAKDRRPRWFKKLVSDATRDGGGSVNITPDRADTLVELVNDLLVAAWPTILRETFAVPGFNESQIQIERSSEFKPFSASLASVPVGDGTRRLQMLRASILDEAGKPVLQFRYPSSGTRSLDRAEDRLFMEIVDRVLFGDLRRRPTIYIPAARTGLMIALRALISQLLDADEEATQLPRPLAEFLRYFTLLDHFDSAQSEVAEWLQREIVHGQIEFTEDEIPSFTYRPDGAEVTLPLHASSSMVTELAPFLVLLRSGLADGQLIFEEPEAHLHIEAQRAMARAIARLVNAGNRIILTTHSDTFVQQINNLMHLHYLHNRDNGAVDLGYDQSDLINPDLVRAYEFRADEDRTQVVQLTRGLGGFVVPSLNETLQSLATETISLFENDDLLEDGDD